MTGYRLFSLFAILLLLAGCGRYDALRPMSSKAPQTPQTPEAKSETVLPEWYRNPPTSSAMLQGVGKGESLPEAKADAVANLRERVSARLLATLESGMESRRGIYRYLDRKSLKAAERSLNRLPFSSYTLLKTQKLPDGTYIVLIGIERKRFVKPLKKSILQRLVAIEERWHASVKESTLQRYRLAEDSFEKMKKLLPDYLAAHAVSPFSRPIVSRIEDGTPYFERVGKRLKRDLRFCVEPANTPALSLFANAVEKALKAERLTVSDDDALRRDALCITVKGRILHERSAGNHIIRAAIELTLHKRYGDPIVIQQYTVKGVSDESGTDALQKAADRLQRTLQKRFLLRV
ncbi:DUF6886 family protein [Hydrogenimonas sp.]